MKFMQWAKPTSKHTVLDVGITDSNWRFSNFFEMWYPYPEKITALSINVPTEFHKAYPNIRVVIGDGRKLPFNDNEFDFSFSNAVIEHVGCLKQQECFVKEMVRVSRWTMIITPDRFFPVDFHTLIPFMHWFPRLVYAPIYRLLGKNFWAKEQNLNLLSYSKFRQLFTDNINVTIYRQRFMGISSQLIAVVEKG